MVSVTATFSWLLAMVKLTMSLLYVPPSAPSARLKSSTTPVLGKAHTLGSGVGVGVAVGAVSAAITTPVAYLLRIRRRGGNAIGFFLISLAAPMWFISTGIKLYQAK